MNRIFYKDNALDKEFLKNVLEESQNLPWCKPPAGIPGNNPPRNVCVLGNGSTVIGTPGSPKYKTSCNYPKNVSYPLYQSAKSSCGVYRMRPIPLNISKLIIKIRGYVKKFYNKSAIDIESMFNVVVCNYYTEDSHQISDHRDDERWLKFNEITNGEKNASIIASLTLYVDDPPSKLRNFEIFNETTNSWNKYNLDHNSLVFFSNHRHRAKSVGKRGESCKRINLTFRTLTDGLLGLTGYGNFYRYMSLPEKIILNKSHKRELIKHFYDSIIYSNTFNKKTIYSIDISIEYVEGEKYRDQRDLLRTRYNNLDLLDLPRYVKSLCTNTNYIYYLNYIKK
jgi:hypothetical protein